MKYRFSCLLLTLSAISMTCFATPSSVPLTFGADQYGHLYLLQSKKMGFFRLNSSTPAIPLRPNIKITRLTNKQQNILRFATLSYFHPDESLVNDMDNPGTKVRRMIIYPTQALISDWTGYDPLLGQSDYTVYFTDYNGTPLGDSEGRLLNENTVPVEFRGGNGDPNNPLTMFIEGGIKFSNIDLSSLDKSHHLELKFCSPHANIKAIDELWSTDYLSVYGKDGKPSVLGQTAIRYQDNCFSLLVTPENFATSVIGFKPAILQVQQIMKLEPAAPKSDWYDVELMMCTHNFPMSCNQLQSTAESDESDPKRGAVQLMVNGLTFTNYNGNTIYRRNRFFVVSDVNSSGGIKLKNWHTDGDFKLGNLTDFNVCQSGDWTGSNNRVRWYIYHVPSYSTYTGHMECNSSGEASLVKDNAADGLPAVNSLIVLEQDPLN